MKFNHCYFGALGQTRTGTPKRARILSPLCLPISSRGPLINHISQRFYNTINLVCPTTLLFFYVYGKNPFYNLLSLYKIIVCKDILYLA